MPIDFKKQQIAFIIDDLTEFYALRELVDALKKENIPTDIIIPSDSGYNGLAEHTFKKIENLGYSPLKDAPKNKIYKILFSPYPTIEVIRRTNFIYQIRMPYSTISAKPNPVYGTEFKIDYDAIICFNTYEPNFLSCYGADCYAVPYWKYDNFQKSPFVSKKPKLLILPTFGQDTSCIKYLTESVIDEIKKHFRIIIKAHHAIHFGRDNQEDFKKLQKLADEFYDSDTPITKLLQKADIALSDNSGSIFEAIYSNTPVVAFSKNLNVRRFNGIDTLQYKLMKDDILPYTNNPTKILSMLLSIKPYFNKQQVVKKELFPKYKGNPLNVTINLIKKYLEKDESQDYKKILHDAMLKEWYDNKRKTSSLETHVQSLQSTIESLESTNETLKSDTKALKATIKMQGAVLSSGAYQLYDKIITPYKKIRSARSKK